MNGYERIKTVIATGKADRTPMMLHNFMSAASEIGISMAEYRTNPARIADAHITAARKYGLDGILIDIDTCIEAGAIGVPVDFPENEPARALGCASDDIERLIEMMAPEKLLKNDRVNILLDAVNLTKQKIGGELWLRGNCDQMAFSLAMLAYGMEDFMADLLDEEMEEKIFLLMDRAYEVHLTLHKLMVEAGADMTSFGDSSCGPDLISRDMYLKYAHPYHKRLQKDLSDAGIPVVCHICGNTDFIMEDVAGIGFTGVEVDYKTNISRAASLLKGKSLMFGPIDPSGTFYFGTPVQMQEETNKVLDIFKGEGLVIGAGCALPSNTSEANIRSFTNTVINYCINGNMQ